MSVWIYRRIIWHIHRNFFHIQYQVPSYCIFSTISRNINGKPIRRRRDRDRYHTGRQSYDIDTTCSRIRSWRYVWKNCCRSNHLSEFVTFLETLKECMKKKMDLMERRLTHKMNRMIAVFNQSTSVTIKQFEDEVSTSWSDLIVFEESDDGLV